MPHPASIPKLYSKFGQLAVYLCDAHSGTRRAVYLGADGTAMAQRDLACVPAE